MANKRRIKRDTIDGYLFILPNLLGFLVFGVIPIILAFTMSLTNWKGMFKEFKFIGLDNYIRLFSHDTFWLALRNTLVFTIGTVPVMLMVALTVAILLNNKIRGVNTYRMIFFMPYVSAMIAVAIIFVAIFHPTLGPVNSFLRSIGIANPPMWAASSVWAMPSVILLTIWKEFGYYMVIYLAGLQGISRALYEAAKIDGADGRKCFRYITLPMLKPITFLCFMLAIISSFKVFDQVYILTEGGPGRATTTMVQFIYDESFGNLNFAYGSAASVVLFIAILLVTLVQIKNQKKSEEY